MLAYNLIDTIILFIMPISENATIAEFKSLPVEEQLDALAEIGDNIIFDDHSLTDEIALYKQSAHDVAHGFPFTERRYPLTRYLVHI